MKCKYCSKKLEKTSNYCPNCGKSQKSISFKYYLVILAISLIAFVIFNSLGKSQIGKKPKLTFKEYQEKRSAKKNENIFTLIEKVKENPKNKKAILEVAQISFENQVFDKSAEYYKKYLDIVPEDNNVRAKYASALSFSGKFESALNELKNILKKDPNNFHANAYTSITLSQLGKNKEALKYGKLALNHAPDKEAKMRFSDFLKKISTNKKNEDKNNVLNEHLEIITFVKNNKIAGPKFVYAKSLDSSTLNLYFNNFPMDKMPDFAKKKFYAGFKSNTKLSIFFYDKQNNALLDNLEIPISK